MRFRRTKIWLLLTVVALGATGSVAIRSAGAANTPDAPVDSAGRVPDEIKNVGIDEHPGATLPLDTIFINDRGESLPLRSYFGHGRPVVLQLGYFECPMLCSLVSQGLVNSAKDLGLKAGTDFDMLFISIDPADTPSLASMKKENTVKYYGKMEEASGFHFLVGKDNPIVQVSNSVGFRFEQMADTQQFAHAAAIFVLTPDGKVSRYLYGTKFAPQTLRLSLVEASENKIGTTIDKIMLICLHYDAATGKYAWAAMTLMRIAGGLTVLVLGGILLTLFLRDHRNVRAASGKMVANRFSQPDHKLN